MRVMRFTAPSMAQAMRQVRQALGPDAVILSTGRLPGGGVEISAAVDQAANAAAMAGPAPDLAGLAKSVEGLSALVARQLGPAPSAARLRPAARDTARLMPALARPG